MSSARDVTQLLTQWSGGDQTALERLLPLVYDELRRQARRYLGGERPDHTLQPTALVHEAYVRLVGQRNVKWQNRAQFFGVAAQLMRRILVDHARARAAAKRGGGASGLSLTEPETVSQPDVEVIALDAALTELSALDPVHGRVVELRFFGGLTIEETAEVLHLSPATIKRDWSVAKAWLYRTMRAEEPS
jgi:RNA polymerase sigma factor (TIGR02999 family)